MLGQKKGKREKKTEINFISRLFSRMLNWEFGEEEEEEEERKIEIPRLQKNAEEESEKI